VQRWSTIEYPTSYLYFHGYHNQCGIRAAHQEKLRCITVKYIAPFLYSDWLYFLWHDIKYVFIWQVCLEVKASVLIGFFLVVILPYEALYFAT